jgi:hypothetical protein
MPAGARQVRQGDPTTHADDVLPQSSHREDVSLANPFGPPARGWDEVARTMDHAASNLRDGAMVAFEEVAKYVTPELAYTVWLERQ